MSGCPCEGVGSPAVCIPEVDGIVCCLESLTPSVLDCVVCGGEGKPASASTEELLTFRPTGDGVLPFAPDVEPLERLSGET